MSAWPVFAIALVAVAAVTPLVRFLAIRRGFVARPSGDRFHARVVALGGGIGLVLVLVPLLLVSGAASRPGLPWLVGALVGTAALGLVDDLRGLRPVFKAAGQLAVAAVLVLGGGLLPAGVVTSWQLIWALPLAVLWIVGVMNACNFLDNMDGILAGIVAVCGAAYWLAGGVADVLLAPALTGAALGFLVHNVPPARLFMGDVGSMSLGLLVAVLSLWTLVGGAAAGAPGGAEVVALRGAAGLARWLGTALVLGYPLLDIIFVSVTRTRRGQPVYQGGCDHTTHRLNRLLGGPWRTALVVYLLAAVPAALGVMALARPAIAGWLALAGTAGLLGLGLALARVPAR
jgi:UDP-GlcNAc:undecaprenyl-phosphate GlcNAc-1-phosphate transferase